jgi:hypothetical protein
LRLIQHRQVCDPSGTVELSGTNWLGGNGVDIYSNGGSVDNDAGNEYVTNSAGASVLSGEEWQCVELINRLYLNRGWITAHWSGDGDELYANTPKGLTKQANGSITELDPGDVISLGDTTTGTKDDDGGHAAIVSSVSGSTVELVNQNTPAVDSSATLSKGTLTMSGWAGYDVIGAIDAPASPTPAPTPPPTPDNDLYFIKTENTGSGEIEVHSATAATGYEGSDLHAATYFSEAEGPDGTWQMWNRNLYDIKTQNTGSGDVEVHDATAASNYNAGDVNAATVFSEADASNGVFEISDTRHDNVPDLVFIKERNTGSGNVEVFVSYGPNYNQLNVADITAFSETDATNGQFQIENSDLVYIKTQNTGTGTVEYFRAPVGYNYGRVTLATGTLFNPADAPNGTFSIEDMNADGQDELVFVKTQNTTSGQVELFTTNGTNYGQLGLATQTYFSEADAVNGTFEIGNGS